MVAVDFLELGGKAFLVLGLANRKSVAYHVGRTLEEASAHVLYSVHTAKRREQVLKLLHSGQQQNASTDTESGNSEGSDASVFVCDLKNEKDIANLAGSVRSELARRGMSQLDGILHSVAYANYEKFSGTFHEVSREDFLEAVDVSCYSLIAVARQMQELLSENASVVTIAISTAHMAAESYGYMAPAKAALESSVTFLAKSFSRFSRIRFNAVGAGLLKTNSSAGIPNYMENYLFAEQATLRRQALATQEVANVAAFLLSPRSSGINAQNIVVDAGMGRNYFDAEIVRHTTAALWPTKS